MIRRSIRRIAVLLAVGMLSSGAAWRMAAAAPMPFVEPPSLVAQVKAQVIPPVAQRLPAELSIARIEQYGGRVGQYGGDWRMLVYRAKDVRMMLIYGYARLVAFDRFYKLEPDLLRSFEVKDGRRFTFTLRRGHKWSDGAPFTSENFRYYWEDVIRNRKLYPGGSSLPRSHDVDMHVEIGIVLHENLDRPRIPRIAWTEGRPS